MEQSGSMDFQYRCSELLSYPSYFVHIDLIELKSRFLDELLRDTKELYNNLRVFEKYCIGNIDSKAHEFVKSMYHLALLKLSATLEDKLRDSRMEDEFTQYIIKYYTQDEKNALRELEKFSKLDPNITSPRVLADIIVAEEGEVFKLIREAVAKEYIDLGRVLRTWESELKIRNDLTRAFISVYQARFSNIVNAIQLLLNQQPGWLKRLFREYEGALLESAEVRKKFEEKLSIVFSREISKLEETLRALEEENNNLRRRIEELSASLILTEDEKRKQDEELHRIRVEYESLRSRYESVLTDLNKKLTEIENLKNLLLEKERELEKMKASHDATQAEKLAIENEIIQLRKTISEYEERIQDYKLLENRVKELESVLRAEPAGNLVKKEEIDYFYEVIAGRTRRMLEDSEIKVFDPRYLNYRNVKKWDTVEKQAISVSGVGGPLSVRSIIFTKLTGILYKKKDMVIEYALLTHFADPSYEEFDVRAVSLSEFTALWRDKVVETEKEKYYHILVIFSPTGFTKELIDYVTGSSVSWASIASKYTTVYLVDFVKNRLYYNINDPVAKSNGFLANIELSEEQVEKVVNYMLSDKALVEAAKRNPAVNFLAVSDISMATGVSDKIALRRALSILEEKGLGKVKRLGSEIVFEYKIR
ncbi:MAG: hypothetical protein QW655_04550 [Nitrososphaerota archaeon]